MIYVPLMTTPVGWMVLGLSGYALYNAGRRKGEEEAAASQITAAPAEFEAKKETTKNETKGDK